MAKQMLKMPIVPRETPTPMPIFLPVSSIAFARLGGSRAVASGVVTDDGVVVEEENVVVVVGTKFQPFSWIPAIAVALCAIDIDVTHPEVTPPAIVTVSYRMRLICCPAVRVDTHSAI
jgi:hypothetical protein